MADKKTMEDTVDRRGWYLDRGMNPVYVGALITIILTVFGWARGLEAGQIKQDEKIGAVEKTTSDLEKRTREDMKEIRDNLQQILSNQKRGK